MKSFQMTPLCLKERLRNLCESIDALKETDEKLKDIEEELDSLIKSIELCPICLKPVHEGCDAFVRYPVTDEKVAEETKGKMK
jgi:DNA repair exonuclease SbcCD ATPase subunit